MHQSRVFGLISRPIPSDHRDLNEALTAFLGCHADGLASACRPEPCQEHPRLDRSHSMPTQSRRHGTRNQTLHRLLAGFPASTEVTMRPRKPPPEKLLIRAVEARAAGNSWEAVAKLVQRASGTVRRWSRRYPEEWDAALQAAQQQVVVQSGNEAGAILRRQLHSDDERLSHQAAWRLIHQRLEASRIALKAAALVPFNATGTSRVEPASQSEKGLSDEQRALAVINLLEPIIGTRIPLQQLLAHFGP